MPRSGSTSSCSSSSRTSLPVFATGSSPPSAAFSALWLGLTIRLSASGRCCRTSRSGRDVARRRSVSYVVVFLAHWAPLSIVVTVASGGRGRQPVGCCQPDADALVCRRRADRRHHLHRVCDRPALGRRLLTQVIAIARCCGFRARPPAAADRPVYWRLPEQQRLQEAIRGLMTLATTRAEVAQRVLGPVAALVGARGAAILDGRSGERGSSPSMRLRRR